MVLRAVAGSGSGGGSSAFNAITSGTNTTAAMVVGSGGTLAATGTGTIVATSLTTLVFPTTTITGNTTLDATYGTVRCDTSGGGFTVTLPAASGANGREYNVKKISSDGNTLTITRTGSDTIDGAANKLVTVQYQNTRLQANATATSWDIL